MESDYQCLPSQCLAMPTLYSKGTYTCKLKFSKILQQLSPVRPLNLIFVQGAASFRRLLQCLHGSNSSDPNQHLHMDGCQFAAKETTSAWQALNEMNVCGQAAWRLTSGERTVMIVGLKEMAEWKRLKMILAASYSVLRTSSPRAQACISARARVSWQWCSMLQANKCDANQVKVRTGFLKCCSCIPLY